VISQSGRNSRGCSDVSRFNIREHRGGRFYGTKNNTNMATIIKVYGKDLKFAYSLLTAISYEKMTGQNALDLKQFESGKLEPVINLAYCMVCSANPEGEVPEYQTFLNSFETIEQMTSLVQAVMTEVAAFFKPTAADKADKQEDAGKNA